MVYAQKKNTSKNSTNIILIYIIYTTRKCMLSLTVSIRLCVYKKNIITKQNLS